ncbi:MAG: aminopeptidase N [Bdellovibrionaceae bacterium]|nr:aminopeptidase N [Pseudobdellovibrionaceae bacterium]
MTTQRIYLKDYAPPAFDVNSVELDFDLQDDFCRVRSRLEIVRRTPGAALELDGRDLDLRSLQLDGRELPATDYQKSEGKLVIPRVPDRFLLEVETRLEPQNNTALEGLYKSNGCFVTQCEAQGFRGITYFLDRPDVMTRYTVRLEADKKKYPVLLSNGDRAHTRDLGNGRHEALWRDPHKKPCYLFALVAGDLGVIRDSFTTRSGRKVNLEVYAAHGKQDRCHHAMSSLKKSMKWDEEAFGREYDLGDYMIVAIDDFNAGAMENKGLNIFNSRLVLADSKSATDHDFLAIESVVGHEYFHNWTGNRVTLQNWFHLSLKEGLTVFRDQEFSADMTDRGVQRIQDVDSLRERQFVEDAGPTAHPVRPESCLAVDNFFTMTIYEKGAELIRMMQTTVGKKGFRRGMDLYFERHDGQAVTTDDFAAAIADANEADFTQLKLWYSQAGTPKIDARDEWRADRGEYVLHLRQSCAPTPGQSEKKPFQIPIRLGFLDDQGRELPLQSRQVRLNSDGLPLIELKEAEQSFVFTGLTQKPHVSLLREFSAPVVLHWDRPDQELFFLMAKDTDGFNRREAAQQAGLRVLARLVADHQVGRELRPDEHYLSAWSEALRADLDPAYQAALLALPSDAMLAQQLDRIDAAAFRAARQALVAALARLNRSELLGLVRRWQGVSGEAIDPRSMGARALKNLALSVLAETGDPEVLDLVHRQYTQAQNMTDRMSALMILADSDDRRRDEALASFHRDWRGDSVVLNKWFTVQANTSRADTQDTVKALVKHPDFQLTNPNNVYALLRVFGQNLVCFHDPKNPGYDFFADRILEIDAKNPQVAARLSASFNVINKLAPELREKALKEIRRILDEPSLSKNTRELLAPTLL